MSLTTNPNIFFPLSNPLPLVTNLPPIPLDAPAPLAEAMQPHFDVLQHMNIEENPTLKEILDKSQCYTARYFSQESWDEEDRAALDQAVQLFLDHPSPNIDQNTILKANAGAVEVLKKSPKTTPKSLPSSCLPSLSAGAVFSLIAQNPLPLLVSLFNCLPEVQADLLPILTTSGDDFRINPSDNSQQLTLTPALALGKDQKTLFAYEAYYPVTERDVVLSQGNPNLLPIGDPIQAVSDRDGKQSRPGIDAFENGNVVVGWMGWRDDGQTFDYPYLRIFDSNLNPLTPEIRASDTETPYEQFRCQIATGSDNTIFRTWTRSEGSGSKIYARPFAQNGTPLRAEFPLSSGANCGESTIVKKSGGYIVGWSSDQLNPSGATDLFGRVVDTQGNFLSEEFQINEVITGTQGHLGGRSFSDDSFQLCWVSTEPNKNPTIQGRRFSAAGQPLTNEYTIAADALLSHEYPSVIAIDDTYTIIIWQINTPNEGRDIYGRIIGPNGELIGDRLRINSYTSDDQSQPTSLNFKNGTALVSWSSPTQQAGLYGRLVSLEFPLPTLSTTTTTDNEYKGHSPKAIDPNLNIAYPDLAAQGATVQITNFIQEEDELGFVNQNGIEGSFDDTVGVMSLSGIASRGNYQKALRNITYTNHGQHPTHTPRSIQFKIETQELTHIIDITEENPSSSSSSSGPSFSSAVISSSALLSSTGLDAISSSNTPSSTSDSSPSTSSSSGPESSSTISSSIPLSSTSLEGISSSATPSFTSDSSSSLSSSSGSDSSSSISSSVPLSSTGLEGISSSATPSSTSDSSSSIPSSSGPDSSSTISSSAPLSSTGLEGISSSAIPSSTSDSSSSTPSSSGPNSSSSIIPDPSSSNSGPAATSSSTQASSTSDFTSSSSSSSGLNSSSAPLSSTGPEGISSSAIPSSTSDSSFSISSSSAPNSSSSVILDPSSSSSGSAVTSSSTQPGSSSSLPGSSGLNSSSAPLSSTGPEGISSSATPSSTSDASSSTPRSSSVVPSSSATQNTLMPYSSTSALASIWSSSAEKKPIYSSSTASVTLNIPSSTGGATAATNESTEDLSACSTDSNHRPVLSNRGGSATFIQNQNGILIDPAFSIADKEKPSILSAIVEIKNNFAVGDTLLFTDQSNIKGQYDINTGVLSLTGVDSIENYQTAIRSILFTTTAFTTNSGARTIRYTVTDDCSSESNQLTHPVNLVAADNSAAHNNDNGDSSKKSSKPAVSIDKTLQLKNLGTDELSNAIVEISDNYVPGEEELQFTDQNGIEGNFATETGVLTLYGKSSVANYQQALQSVTYRSFSDRLNQTFDFMVSDEEGNNDTFTRSVKLEPKQEEPERKTDAKTTAGIAIGAAAGGLALLWAGKAYLKTKAKKNRIQAFSDPNISPKNGWEVHEPLDSIL